MASEGGPQTSGDYITHHLQNLQACKNDAGEWIFGACPGEFWAINVDSMFWAVLLGLVFCWTFYSVARKPSIDRPSRWQALSLIHISEPTRLWSGSRMPSSA